MRPARAVNASDLLLPRGSHANAAVGVTPIISATSAAPYRAARARAGVSIWSAPIRELRIGYPAETVCVVFTVLVETPSAKLDACSAQFYRVTGASNAAIPGGAGTRLAMAKDFVGGRDGWQTAVPGDGIVVIASPPAQ